MEQRESGSIIVKERAIAEIARLSAMKVPHVVALKGNIFEQSIEFFWKKFPYSGIRIILTEKEVAIQLSIVAEFGSELGEVSAQVQDKVRNTVENMTGLSVSQIDVNVVGIS